MITILCSGTRGDVQPYIALAQELKKLGLSARIASSRMFESFEAFDSLCFPREYSALL